MLARILDSQHLPPAPRYHVELAFDEIAGNIVRHGLPSGAIDVRIAFGDREVVLSFEDDGTPFDPRTYPPAVLPTSIDDARVGRGGLGLPLVRSISSAMTYGRTPQQRNQLTLVIPAS